MERWIKPGFTVIGREGSTEDGPGFVDKLWTDANWYFREIADLVKMNPDGHMTGLWGAMTDTARRFLPWEEDFSRGLYLAGAECGEAAQPPEGWVRWDVPGFEYVRIRMDGPEAFRRGLELLAAEGLTLVGAVQEYTDMAQARTYLCYPIRRLDAGEEV